MPKTDVKTLNQKLDWVKERTAKAIDLAMERVIAHNENPKNYPLPKDGKSLEQALHRLFNSLPRKNQKDLIEKVNKTLKADKKARTKIYGDLVDTDFRSKSSVVEQIKARPVPANLKVTESDVTELRKRLKIVKPSKPLPAQGAEAVLLAFEVLNLTCVRPTDIRKDETSLAGVGIDNLGRETIVAPFFVGDFKKGDTVALGAQGRILNFKLTEGQFPKTFAGVIFLVEKDWLRNSEFVRGLQVFLFSVCAATTAIGAVMVVVGVAGGPFSVLLTAALLGAGVFFGLATSAVRRMTDDVSFGNGDALVLDAPVAPGTVFDIDPLGIQIGELKGKYTATARWIAE